MSEIKRKDSIVTKVIWDEESLVCRPHFIAFSGIAVLNWFLTQPLDEDLHRNNLQIIRLSSVKNVETRVHISDENEVHLTIRGGE